MNEGKRPDQRYELVDISEKIEDCLKIIFVILAALALLALLFNFFLSDAIDFSLRKMEAENTRLNARKIEIEKKIQYLQGKWDNLDPVFDWWFSLMWGRDAARAEKNRRNFEVLDYCLRYVGI